MLPQFLTVLKTVAAMDCKFFLVSAAIEMTMSAAYACIPVCGGRRALGSASIDTFHKIGPSMDPCGQSLVRVIVFEHPPRVRVAVLECR